MNALELNTAKPAIAMMVEIHQIVDGGVGEPIAHRIAAVARAEIHEDAARCRLLGHVGDFGMAQGFAADLVRDKKLEGIAGIADESDRIGVRVVIELKRDATPDVVLNQLFRFTPMQTSFGCNMLALNGGRPVSMS